MARDISLDFVDMAVRLHSRNRLRHPRDQVVYISREFSCFFLPAKKPRGRSALHSDRWSRGRLVFQDSGTPITSPANNRELSLSLSLSSSAGSRDPVRDLIFDSYVSVGGRAYAGRRIYTHTGFYMCPLPPAAITRPLRPRASTAARRKIMARSCFTRGYIDSAKLE